MAKVAASKSKPKAGALQIKKLEAKKSAKKQANNKLQELLDIEESAVTRKKKAAKGKPPERSQEETIRNKIRDSFAGFSEAELTMNFQGGFNVFGQLLNDMQRKADGEAVSMGKNYYADLRMLFRDPDSPMARLVVVDDMQPIFVLIHEWAESMEAVS